MKYDVTIGLPSEIFEVEANSPTEAITIAFNKIIKGEGEIFFTVRETLTDDYDKTDY